MSINITLHGNSFYNNRENRMSGNLDYAKKQELDRRKRLRLEQVREQSKVLARDIRKKYEDEKRRQEKCLEQCKAKELKLWQKKNIEKYQKEYEKCIKNVGSAHKAAKKHENDENLNQVKVMTQRTVAAKRGLLAAERIRKSQEANRKKKTINKLKQKTVSIQTEFNSLLSTDSDMETSKLLDNLSSDESLEEYRQDNVYSDKPFTNYKPDASKTIISSSDDEEEIKILSDMTSEENEQKRFTQDTKRQQSVDPNYDRPVSDYKTSYYPPDNRPFSQVSDFIQKRKEKVPEYRPVLAEVGNYSRSLDASRSLLDKEKLGHLIRSPSKPHCDSVVDADSRQRPIVQKQFQPSLQRVTNAIDQTKRKTRTIRSQVVSATSKKNVNKRPPEQIPTNNQGAAGRQKIQQDFNKLTKQLDTLTAEERHWKAYDTSEYDYSTDKVMKDAQSRQERMEIAFKDILSRPAVITCPKVNPNVELQRENLKGPSVNVAELFASKGHKASKFTSAREKQLSNPISEELPPAQIVQQAAHKTQSRKAELDHIVNIEMLKDLLERINEQKQSLLYEIQKDGTVPDITKYKDTIEKLEKQKEVLLRARYNQDVKDRKKDVSKVDTDDKIRLAQEKLELEKREQKLLELESRLEHEMKKLYQKTKKVKTDKKEENSKQKSCPIQITSKNVDPKQIKIVQDDSSTSTSTVSEPTSESNSEQLLAPVKIVIKVNDIIRRKHHKINTETSTVASKKVVLEKIKDKPSKEYPKTPLKKSILKNDKVQEKNASVIVIDDTIESKPIEESTNVTELDRKSPEVSGESGSTTYREPPPSIKTEFSKFLDRVTRETFDERRKKEEIKAAKQMKQNETHQRFPNEKPLNHVLSHYITRLLGMSRDSIDKLGVSSGSDIPTPNTSVIDVSNNISTASSLEQVERLKRFVSDNNNFINEVNQTLEKKRLDGTVEENTSVVENVWKETLGKREKQMKARQDEIKRKVTVSPLKKKRVSRPCNQPIKPILKRPNKQKSLNVEPPPVRTSRLCRNAVGNTKNSSRCSTISSMMRSKSASPRKNRQPFPRHPEENVTQMKDRRARSVSPPTRSLQSPVTLSTDSPNQLKSILKSPRKQLAANINEIIGEVELLRVAGKHEDKILDKYAELTENCSKRISELAQLIERARVDKRMILELSFTSTEQPNSTEYFEIPTPVAQNNVADDRTSPETISYQEVNQPTMKQMQKIGKSRDSGISISRPMTSSDFRGSTEHVSPQQSPEFVPLLKDIPKVRHVDKLHDNSAEKLHEELQKFGSYIKDLDNSMSKLTTATSNKSKVKPPSSMNRYNPEQLQEQAHELSTIIEAESSVTSRLNVSSTDKPVPKLTEKSIELRPEDFPNFDEYLKARVEQFTQDSINTTEYIKKLLQTSTNVDELEYNKYPSIIDDLDLPSIILEHVQNSADSLKEDIFGDIYGELKRRKIIDKSVDHQSKSSGTSLESSGEDSIFAIKSSKIDKGQVVSGSTGTTPKISETIKNPVSPRKPKQFETRVVQKTPQKEMDYEELNETEPKTPTKMKTVHKKHTPKKHSHKMNRDNSNLSGIGLLQKSANEPMQQLETEMTELGIDWAVSTLRRTQQAQALSSSSSTVSANERTSKTNTANNTNKPQKPIGLREFLTRELMFRSQQSNSSSNETSLSSQFLKSLMNISGIPSSSSNSGSNSNPKEMNDIESALFKRTSTPLQERSTTAPTSSESHLSSVRSDQSSDTDKKSSKNKDVPLKVPDIKNAEQYVSASSTSHSE